MTTTSYLPIAVRAYAERAQKKAKPSRRAHSQSVLLPEHVLVFDTETTTDASQRLVFGSYRHLRVTWQDGRPHAACVEEGFFSADDLSERAPLALTALRNYVAAHEADVAPGVSRGLKLLSCREFVNKVLYPAAYTLRATVVAFNLPFDISRIAYGVGEARGRFAGGFSFALWGYEDAHGVWHVSQYRPRIAIKSIDSKRALKGFTLPAQVEEDDRIPDGAPGGKVNPTYAFRGHFLDLRTLAFALTDESHSLDSACKAFGVTHGKATARRHGAVTPAYIAYNRRDTQATSELFVKLMEDYAKHPIDLQATKAYSPASIGKGYLRGMGIRPILERQPDFPKDVLGYAMTAYFGGRAECRIRRVPVPVVYVDFLSMYPTVCSLMEMMHFLTCERVEVQEATDDVQAMLAGITLQDGFNPHRWPQWVSLVLVLPQDDILACRARYAGGATWPNGVNPLTCAEPLWFTLPDLIASTLLTGKPPNVLRAIRFVPCGADPDLRPVALRNAVRVDPRSQDFFKVANEERKRISARRAIPGEERRRLDQFLKVLANATSYGIFAEMVREELPSDEREAVPVHGLDPKPFTARVQAPESPGEFAFPPMAACIAGGARLMLALLERLVTDAGGTYAFCDTDSMAVVATETGGLVPCPGGPEWLPDGTKAVRALPWVEVEKIRERFTALNPFDREAVPGSILKLEDENFDEDTGHRRQLWCYGISAKRYALFNLAEQDRPLLRKWSEHGLGHLLNPTNPDDESRDWIRMLWEGMVTEAVGQTYSWPDWLNRPAVGRITVSSPSLLRLFKTLNRGKPYADQVKPYNFLLTAFVAPFGHPVATDPEHFQLIAPWNPDPRQWSKIAWTDRYSGRRLRMTTTGTGGHGVARVKTYADVLSEYKVHPEPKSLDPDGQPCGRATIGLLSRRPVTATHIVYIGKESNRLEDVQAGVIHDSDEVLTEYADPRRDPWRTLTLPVLRNLSTEEIASSLGATLSTVKRIRSGRSVPRPKLKTALFAFAARAARGVLNEWGVVPPVDDLACCYAYLDERRRRKRARTCAICGAQLASARALTCSPACRQRLCRRKRKAGA